MADDRLAAAFRRASEIARAVPKHLQETAFNRALDQLLKDSGVPATKRAGNGKSKSGSRSQKSKGKTADQDVLDQLLRDLDRTKYPEIKAENQALKNALGVLRAAKRDHGVDGLEAPQIARILTDKFRVSTGDGAVSMALGRAGKYVNRLRVGRGYTYRVMDPGEKYLDSRESDAPPKREGTRSAGGNRSRGKKANRGKKAPDADHAKSAVSRRGKPSASRPGPKAAVDTLIKAGFFAHPRVLGDIQAHLQIDRGYAYAVTDLSPTMTRAVRSGALKRSRRQDGQYEYQAG